MRARCLYKRPLSSLSNHFSTKRREEQIAVRSSRIFLPPVLLATLAICEVQNVFHCDLSIISKVSTILIDFLWNRYCPERRSCTLNCAAGLHSFDSWAAQQQESERRFAKTLVLFEKTRIFFHSLYVIKSSDVSLSECRPLARTHSRNRGNAHTCRF